VALRDGVEGAVAHAHDAFVVVGLVVLWLGGIIFNLVTGPGYYDRR
jgi:hypothetical protein